LLCTDSVRPALLQARPGRHSPELHTEPSKHAGNTVVQRRENGIGAVLVVGLFLFVFYRQAGIVRLAEFVECAAPAPAPPGVTATQKRLFCHQADPDSHLRAPKVPRSCVTKMSIFRKIIQKAQYPTKARHPPRPTSGVFDTNDRQGTTGVSSL
jgi:hypothetical protein